MAAIFTIFLRRVFPGMNSNPRHGNPVNANTAAKTGIPLSTGLLVTGTFTGRLPLNTGAVVLHNTLPITVCAPASTVTVDGEAVQVISAPARVGDPVTTMLMVEPVTSVGGVVALAEAAPVYGSVNVNTADCPVLTVCAVVLEVTNVIPFTLADAGKLFNPNSSCTTRTMACDPVLMATGSMIEQAASGSLSGPDAAPIPTDEFVVVLGHPVALPGLAAAEEICGNPSAKLPVQV